MAAICRRPPLPSPRRPPPIPLSLVRSEPTKPMAELLVTILQCIDLEFRPEMISPIATINGQSSSTPPSSTHIHPCFDLRPPTSGPLPSVQQLMSNIPSPIIMYRSQPTLERYHPWPPSLPTTSPPIMANSGRHGPHGRTDERTSGRTGPKPRHNRHDHDRVGWYLLPLITATLHSHPRPPPGPADHPATKYRPAVYRYRRKWNEKGKQYSPLISVHDGELLRHK